MTMYIKLMIVNGVCSRHVYINWISYHLEGSVLGKYKENTRQKGRQIINFKFNININTNTQVLTPESIQEYLNSVLSL